MDFFACQAFQVNLFYAEKRPPQNIRFCAQPLFYQLFTVIFHIELTGIFSFSVKPERTVIIIIPQSYSIDCNMFTAEIVAGTPDIDFENIIR